MASELTVKTVLIGVGSRGEYPQWVWRVVRCRADQSGYKTEKGVKVIYESPPLYRPKTASGRGKGPYFEKLARKIASESLLKELGV